MDLQEKKEPVCDFCGSLHPVYLFESDAIAIVGADPHNKTDVIEVRDPWAACETCAAYVKGGYRQHLLERSVHLFMALNPTANERVVRAFTQIAHETFWFGQEKREGNHGRYMVLDHEKGYVPINTGEGTKGRQ